MIDKNTTVVNAIQAVTVGDITTGIQTIVTVFFVIVLIAFIGMMFSRPRF